ncbi:MAG: hypothetical protein AB1700_12945 [Bacillota bacterium]
MNLRDKGPLFLEEANFDSLTMWPMAPWRRPSGFDPEAILEEGENPGLGLRALQQEGVTGKGVAIAPVVMYPPMHLASRAPGHPRHRYVRFLAVTGQETPCAGLLIGLRGEAATPML